MNKDTIKPSEVSDVLLAELQGIDLEAQYAEVGTTLQVSDGVVRIYGLRNAEANELLEFENGIKAVVMNLEEDNVGAVLLGPTDLIKEGDLVRRTGHTASIRVSEALLGRVITPLGDPLDGKGPIGGETVEMPLERKAPGVIFRQPVSEPLQTGLKAVDAMIPIGRGQRELILRRPSGREAYPGDIFYLHSRLLERAAKIIAQEEVAREMNDLPESLRGKVRGGGSLTALPIIETQAGDVSAYIPTNVISITDGQIFLDTNLFNQGNRPAVDVGISVSRVGGNAQIKAMKKVAGTLKIDQAQYRELESFSKFSSDMDAVTVAVLDRGRKNTRLLVQPQYSPMPVEQQIAVLYCGTHGLLREVPIERVAEFERMLVETLSPEVFEALRRGEIDESIGARIEEAAGRVVVSLKKHSAPWHPSRR